MIFRCRYCNAQQSSHQITQHENYCLKNASFRRSIRNALDDGTGQARRRKAYDALPNKPVSSAWILQRFGTWDAAAEAMGLDATVTEGINVPLTDAERFCCQRRARVEMGW